MLGRLTRRLRRRKNPPRAPVAESVPLPGIRDLMFADLDSAGAIRVFGLGPRPLPIAIMAAAVNYRPEPTAHPAGASWPGPAAGSQAVGWTLTMSIEPGSSPSSSTSCGNSASQTM
jgi:hypothetical protein